MQKHMNRRNALVSGTATAGVLIGTACSKPEQTTQQKAPHPPFLTPWSPLADLKRDLTPGTTPIRLASWSNATTLDYPKDISITELVKRIRDAGYTAGNAYIRYSGDNLWLKAPESDIKELKEALNKYDVNFFDVHTVGYNIHPDLSERQKNYKYVAEACETAERVGCPMVTTHAGTRSAEHQIAPHKDNWTWETWKMVVDSFKQILKDTAGMNVALGVEAVNMTCMNNPKAHLQLIEDVGDPRLKVCLDPVNMISLRNYFRTTELVNECFDLLGENIIAAHAKDTYILPNRMSAYITEVAVGEGMMDYETYLVRFSRLSYPRPLLIEHLPQEKYPVAKKNIEEIAAKVGVKFYS